MSLFLSVSRPWKPSVSDYTVSVVLVKINCNKDQYFVFYWGAQKEQRMGLSISENEWYNWVNLSSKCTVTVSDKWLLICTKNNIDKWYTSK